VSAAAAKGARDSEAEKSGARTLRAQVALVGRPNSGKSSLYNAITAGDAHIGNFPGITVDILEADVDLPGGGVARVADLPGLYSLDAVVDPATDEGVAAKFVKETEGAKTPLVLVQVIDGTQLALGLRLTRELVKHEHRLIVAVTQRDLLEAQGHTLDVKALEDALGVTVVHVSARNTSAKSAVLTAVGDALLREPHAQSRDLDPVALARSVVRDSPEASAKALRRRGFTARVDSVILHSALGPVLFLSLMALVFAAVFLVADPVTNLMDAAVDLARTHLTHWLGAGMLASFVCDGLLAGAGTVFAFMPQIVILSVALEVLEATGYLARGAFLVDQLLRLLGLSGRSFLPLLMGHACAVPAIASTRIIRDPRERLTTILVLPLMTCSARIPTYALILGTFFAGRGAWFKAAIFVGLYFAGILSGLVASLVLRRTATKGRSLPLVLEMPQYRAPQARLVARKAGQSAGRFLRDVGTVIVASSAILWALLTVPMPRVEVTNADVIADQSTPPIERSIAAGVGHALEPVTAPLGFDWRINVGLIGSFGARELMVSTLGVIFGIENAGDDSTPLATQMRTAKSASGGPAYSTATAFALLAFFVIACQCMSTLAAIRRETKSLRWPAFVLAYTYVAAYAVALVVHVIARAFGA
jgi:ferrous iron transport protein B